MPAVLASTLSSTRVVSTSGHELGTLHNLTFDPQTGTLQAAVIETESDDVFGIEPDADGYVRLPAPMLESVDDHLIVRPTDGDSRPE